MITSPLQQTFATVLNLFVRLFSFGYSLKSISQNKDVEVFSSLICFSLLIVTAILVLVMFLVDACDEDMQ